MDKKTKNWFDKFSLGCPWHDSGYCQAITHRDEDFFTMKPVALICALSGISLQN